MYMVMGTTGPLDWIGGHLTTIYFKKKDAIAACKKNGGYVVLLTKVYGRKKK